MTSEPAPPATPAPIPPPTPEPPRRRRLGADERREQLMAAAVELLAARGFRDTSAEAIAQRAGVSKGLLWHHFTDLDALFEATAHRTLATLSAAAAAAIDLTAPVPDVIRSAVRAAAHLRRTHAAERRALYEIVLNLRTPEGALRFGQRELSGLYAAQEAIFRRGQREGDLRETLDPRLLAVTYQGAVDSMLTYLDAYPETDADHHAETVAEILLAGVARTPT